MTKAEKIKAGMALTMPVLLIVLLLSLTYQTWNRVKADNAMEKAYVELEKSAKDSRVFTKEARESLKKTRAERAKLGF